MILLDKSLLRTQYRELRKKAFLNKSSDEKIIVHVLEIVEQYCSCTNTHMKNLKIGLFYPLKGEPKMLSLSQHFNNILFPKVKDDSMDFVKSNTYDLKQWKANEFGILEPQTEDICIPDIVLIPGLVFDTYGGRIGTGQGFYDRYISKYKNEIKIKIGVCYEFQVIDDINSRINLESHDQKVDYIVSEFKVYEASNTDSFK